MFSFTSIPKGCIAWTKSDTVDCPENMVGIYCGGAGAIAVTDMENRVVTFAAVPVGALIPIKVRRIMSTNTAATNIVVLLR